MTQKLEEKARELAREIGKDIADRRGLKWEWNKVDDDVKEQQIYPAWEKLLAGALAACALEEAKWWYEGQAELAEMERIAALEDAIREKLERPGKEQQP